jgi:DNA-binding transcriptional ArsR family regulator
LTIGFPFRILNHVVENTDVLSGTVELSKVFAALGDPIRCSLVARLARSDATVGELAQPFQITLQAISKHLKVLEAAGLVTKIKAGQRRTVHLEADVFDLMDGWIERYRREAEQRYRRLDAVLADLNPTTTTNPNPIRKGKLP